MEIKQNTLVLVTSGLKERSLGVVDNNGFTDGTYRVIILSPKWPGLPPNLRPEQLMPLAENIGSQDINEKLAPVILELAKRRFELRLLIGA